MYVSDNQYSEEHELWEKTMWVEAKLSHLRKDIGQVL